MSRRKRLLAALAALLALALLLPLLTESELLRQPARAALEGALGRRVESDGFGWQVLPWPGLVARRARLLEDPAFGHEPFLYAEEVQGRLDLRRLLRGELRLAEVRLVSPSINLVRNGDQQWNLASFLLTRDTAGGEGAEGSSSAPPPVVSAHDARVNLKLGADKQVYALAGADLRLEPRAEGGWRFQLQGTPVRTDRRLIETGTVRLEGEVGRAAGFDELPFSLEVQVERSSLAPLWALVMGRRSPVRGLASLAAALQGTPAQWRAQGTARLSAVHGWDRVAPARVPGWEAQFNLMVAERGRTVELEAVEVRGPQSRLRLTGRVENPLTAPRWDLRAVSERLALDEFFRQLAALRPELSPEARLEGEAHLAARLQGSPARWTAELSVPETARLRVPDLPGGVELEGLQARLQDGTVTVEPFRARFSPEQFLTLSGRLRVGGPGAPYRVRGRSEGVVLESLQKAAAVFGWHAFGDLSGQAALDLTWTASSVAAAPRWRGQVRLANAEFHPDEFNQPLAIPEANLVWERNRFRVASLTARVGEDLVSITLERRGRMGRWTGRLEGPRLDLGAVDALLNPARRGLVARLVGRAREGEPAWKKLEMIATVALGELIAGPFRFSRLRAQGEWQAGWLELSRLRFRAYGGRFNGRLQADFRDSVPQYRLAGNLRDVQLGALAAATTTTLGELVAGRLGAEVALQTEGDTRGQLLRGLQGRIVGGVQDGALSHINLLAVLAAVASIEGTDLPTGERTELQSLSGEFRLRDQRVEMEQVRVILRRAAFELSGEVGFDGELALELRGQPSRVGGRRPSASIRALLQHSFRLTGELRRPRVELSAAPPATDEEP